jgi:hypothetical protein
MLPSDLYSAPYKSLCTGIVFNDLYRIVDELILDHRVYKGFGMGGGREMIRKKIFY